MLRTKLPTLHRSLILACTALGALIVSLPSVAQRAGDGQGSPPQQQQQTKVVPALRFAIGEQFTKAQECMDEEDIPCAL